MKQLVRQLPRAGLETVARHCAQRLLHSLQVFRATTFRRESSSFRLYDATQFEEVIQYVL